MKNLWIVFLFCLSIMLPSCNDEDLTPVFIEITQEDLKDCLDMSDFNARQNSSYLSASLAAIANQDFSHIALQANGKDIGIYELPAKIPLLESGNVKLRIYPCFKMNGMSTTIRGYQVLVEPFEATVSLKKGETFRFPAQGIKFKYLEGLALPLLETFETTFSFLPSDTMSRGIVLESLNGNGVGTITLNAAQSSFEIISPEMTLPGQGRNLFLEMNYQTDQEFFVSIMLYNTSYQWVQQSLVGIRPDPNKQWKKIYINLTDIVSNTASLNETIKSKIVIAGNRFDAETAKFCFDNIKIVYIKRTSE